ncbi:hypothetical protein SAMN05444271_102130 [Halohasta litchfieldiae]|uniref:Uncharacterized protein n=1 Tax=Halohasta litchfieldiae TaxID=1073996 RepID=A0A1H6RR44_9EURY|nr:hypothetical protein SAMN05444271_102130 [Halohasta litchfieldiae]
MEPQIALMSTTHTVWLYMRTCSDRFQRSGNRILELSTIPPNYQLYIYE